MKEKTLGYYECYDFECNLANDIYDIREIMEKKYFSIEQNIDLISQEVIQEAVNEYLDQKAEIIKSELEYAVYNYDESYFNYEYTADIIDIPENESITKVQTTDTFGENETSGEQVTVPRNIEAAEKILQSVSGRDFLKYDALVRDEAFAGSFSYEIEKDIDSNNPSGYRVYFCFNSADMFSSESQIKSEFAYQFNATKEEIVSEYDQNIYTSSERLSTIKNLKYYTVSKNDEVNKNVENKPTLETVKSNDIYIVFDGKNVTVKGISNQDTAKNIKNNFTNASGKECYIYFSTDNLQDGDLYEDIYTAYMQYRNYKASNLIMLIIPFLVLSLLFLVCLLCLCGHTNDSDDLQIAFTDKIPTDIHFLLNIGIVIGGVAIVGMVLFDDVLSNNYTFYKYNRLVGLLLSLLCGAIWLVFTEWITSVFRIKKANISFFCNTLIYRASKYIFIKTKNFTKKIKRIFSYKPQKMQKQTILLIIGYIFVNLLFALIAIIFGYYAPVIDILIFILAVVFNVCVLIFLLNYVEIFDEIIVATCEHKTLSYDNKQVPVELKLLADNLANSNQQLQDAIQKAVKDEQMKTELITNVSHDLKTPLTSLITYSDLLEKCNITDENAIKYTNVIHRQSIKLKRLIEDLIEASKVSTGNVTLHKAVLNLSELAVQAITEFSSEIEKNGNIIVFNEPDDAPKVFADSSKTYRIISNLLSNAKKYSAPDTRIYISVYSDGINGYFEIKNISSEPLNISPDELTERFVRGDKSRSKDGNGLGLSIAKELCNIQNGELKIIIDGDLFKAIVMLPIKNNDEIIIENSTNLDIT